MNFLLQRTHQLLSPVTLIVHIHRIITIIVTLSIHHGSYNNSLAGQTLLSFSMTGEGVAGNCGQSIVTAASECVAQLPDSLPLLGSEGGIYESG